MSPEVNDPDRPIYMRAVAELAEMPKLITKLQVSHVRDDDGMCVDPVCGRPGRGTPYLPWPCPGPAPPAGWPTWR